MRYLEASSCITSLVIIAITNLNPAWCRTLFVYGIIGTIISTTIFISYFITDTRYPLHTLYKLHMIEVITDFILFLFGACSVVYFVSNIDYYAFSKEDHFYRYCAAGATAMVSACAFVVNLAFTFSERKRPSTLNKYKKIIVK